jgi:hypothetical protein
MSGWVQWIYNRIKNLDMLGPIWFANLDCLVNNVRYLHDDSYEYKQPSEPYFTDKSNESELGNKSANAGNDYATSHCGTCHGTRPNCYCNFPTHRIDGHNVNRVSRKNGVKWGDICTKPRYKYYDDVGYRESTRNTEG